MNLDRLIATIDADAPVARRHLWLMDALRWVRGEGEDPQASVGRIRQFLATHAPLPDNMRLEEAPFWTPAQAQLLREERVDDADWIVVIDQLNAAMHASPAN